MTTDSRNASALLTTDVDGGTLSLRLAVRGDLPAILQLLADDRHGAGREELSELWPYERAFEAIDADPAHLLVVGELDGTVAATFQLSFIPGLSRKGSWRAQIEAVRVSAALRGHGVGAVMMKWAIRQARAKGCTLVQLTTDQSRTEAHRFYERLGFEASHVGMKLALSPR